MKKTFWKIMIILALISVNVILVSSLISKMRGNEQSATKTSVKTEMAATEIKNTIAVSGNKIIIQGMTNLPEGTNVKYNLWHLDKFATKSNVEKVVAVQNNSLSCEIVLDGNLSPQEMTLNSEVFFNNNNQPDQVKQILGDKGRYLTGSNVKYMGDYKALLLQDKITYGDVTIAKSSLSDEDKIRAAITKAVSGLTGIEIYKKYERYAVEATYTLKDGIGLKSAAEKVARDFTFAAYATGSPILRTSITINKPDGIIGLLVTVGDNQASTQPVSTWTDSKVGPTIFMDWVKQNTNSDYKNIENHTTAKYNFN